MLDDNIGPRCEQACFRDGRLCKVLRAAEQGVLVYGGVGHHGETSGIEY